jgi:hypothetical protein
VNEIKVLSMAQVELIFYRLHDYVRRWTFPEDGWLSLSDSLDVNFWTEEHEETVMIRATLYPVVNGQTDTRTGIYTPIFGVHVRKEDVKVV